MANADVGREPMAAAQSSATGDDTPSLAIDEQDRSSRQLPQPNGRLFRTGQLLALGSGMGIVLVVGFVYLWPGLMGRSVRDTPATPAVVATSQQPDTQQSPIPGLEPTDQLVAYLDGLKAGRYRFDEFETGAEIGRSLGYSSALFQSVYKELAYRVRMNVKRNLSAPERSVVDHLERIVRDEQSIKGLIVQRDPRTVAAIAYLRDLQYGKANFPNPLLGKPSGREVLQALAIMHPDARIELSDMLFIVVYERTLNAVDSQMRTSGSSSIYEVIAEFRSNIVKSSVALESR